MSKPKGYRVLNELAKSVEEWLEKLVFNQRQMVTLTRGAAGVVEPAAESHNHNPACPENKTNLVVSPSLCHYCCSPSLIVLLNLYFEHLYSILSLDVNDYRHAACA